MKKNNILKKELKEILDELPVYYKTMEERPEAKIQHTEFNSLREGYFNVPNHYYKPISKIFMIEKNEKNS